MKFSFLRSFGILFALVTMATLASGLLGGCGSGEQPAPAKESTADTDLPSKHPEQFTQPDK